MTSPLAGRLNFTIIAGVLLARRLALNGDRRSWALATGVFRCTSPANNQRQALLAGDVHRGDRRCWLAMYIASQQRLSPLTKNACRRKRLSPAPNNACRRSVNNGSHTWQLLVAGSALACW